MTPEERELELQRIAIEENDAAYAEIEQQDAAPVTNPSGLGEEYNPEQPQPEQPQPEQAAMPQEEEEEKPLGVGDVAGAIALGAVTATPDFVMDAVGKIPGLGALDDSYDAVTKWEDPRLQKIRSSMSIIVPSIVAGIGATVATRGRALPGVTKGLTALGAGLVADVAVTGISDNSETEATLLTEIDKMAPWLNVPDKFITLDEDGPEVRREKNMYESVGMSFVGEVIGAAIALRKPILRWFKAKDAVAEGALTKGKQTITSYTDTIPNDLEARVQRGADSRQLQIDEDAIRALEADPASVGYNANVMSGIASEASTARQSIPPMAVARNMLDTTALKRGTASGTPSPMITTSMYDEGLKVTGDSRNVIVGVGEEARQLGRFEGIANGFKYSQKDMTDAAWEIYQSIVRAGSVEDVKNLFLDTTQARQVLADGRSFEYLNETQAVATGFALRDLTEKYLSKESAEVSARVMDTLGREITDVSTAVREFASVADDKVVGKMIVDKLHFLMDEYALNKYISGWQLQNKKWWKRIGKGNGAEVVEQMTEEFDAAAKARKTRNANVMNEIDNVVNGTGDRRVGQALMEAFALSNGDVDTIAKTYEYFNKMNSPLGALYNEGGMNLFARGLTAVRYQNILSGLAAVNATLGTAVGLSIKPINAMIGLGMESLFTRDMKHIKGGLAAYGAIAETNKRALSHAFETFKKAMHSPEFSLERARMDMALENNKEWDFVDGLAETMDFKDNPGGMMMYNFNRMTNWLSNSPVMRLGTNVMIAADAYNGSAMASLAGRQDAYYKHVKGGKLDVAAFRAAEAENYKNMFDANGLITDSAVKHASGELALNLDSPMASAITQMTTTVPPLKAIFSFPRTGIEAFRTGIAYTPLAIVPGVSRTSDILLAGNNLDKIKKALKAHKVNVDVPTEDLMNTYKNLRAEYGGRMAFSGMLVAGLSAYAMDGGIIGGGDMNASVRRNQRNTLGVKPYTLRLPNGQYMSYRGLGEPFETVFSILGDMAYNANELRGGAFEDIQTKLMWTFTHTFTQKTFVSQLEPFVALVTGDEGAMQRFMANEARAFVPLSGTAGVVQAALDNARKDIYGDMQGYIKSRLPGLSDDLPTLRDIWTGEPLQDTTNPILRMFNALNPLKISDGNEEWRQTLYEIGYDGVGLILGDGGSNTQYPAEVREILYEYIGEQQPYKEVARFLKSKKYNDQLEAIKKARLEGYSSEEIRTKFAPIFDRIDGTLKKAQANAELKLSKTNPEMARYIKLGRLSRSYQEQGNLEKAKPLIKEQRKLAETLGINK